MKRLAMLTRRGGSSPFSFPRKRESSRRTSVWLVPVRTTHVSPIPQRGDRIHPITLLRHSESVTKLYRLKLFAEEGKLLFFLKLADRLMIK
jgi:hypothetical protein